MNSLMVSVSGIRGVFGTTMTPQKALTFAANFGIFSKRGKIVIGRDSRTTGLAMFNAISSGLISVGCDVIDLGVVATPTVLLTVKELSAAGGICITASHNPPEWNAMKLVGDNAMFLFPEVSDDFISVITREVEWANWQSVGKIYYDGNSKDRHINKIMQIPYLNPDAIREKNYKVVIDSVNGAGGLISPQLLEKLGCKVIEINSDPSGIFSHPAEPLNHNLSQLEQAVKDNSADIGFATDPDVDRLAIVSEKGKCIGEELTVALAEMFVLSKKKGDIVVNLSSSMISDYIAGQFGVNIHRTSIGEINVSKKMLETGSPIGGEGNGGVVCPDVHYSRDALTGMALILGLLTDRKQKVSEIAESLPRYYMCKSKIETVSSKVDIVMSKAAYMFDGLKVDNQDGIKASGDNFWIQIRKSGTEPIIRIYVESEDPEKSADICSKTVAKLIAY